MLTTATTATFKITDAKLYVPIVTLSSEDNAKLTKLLNEKFKVKRLFVLAYDNTAGNNQVSLILIKTIFSQELKQKLQYRD